MFLVDFATTAQTGYDLGLLHQPNFGALAASHTPNVQTTSNSTTHVLSTPASPAAPISNTNRTGLDLSFVSAPVVNTSSSSAPSEANGENQEKSNRTEVPQTGEGTHSSNSSSVSQADTSTASGEQYEVSQATQASDANASAAATTSIGYGAAASAVPMANAYSSAGVLPHAYGAHALLPQSILNGQAMNLQFPKSPVSGNFQGTVLQLFCCSF